MTQSPAVYLVPLPRSPADLADATWETIKPLYDAVALAPLSAETVEAWLASWSRLEELVSESASLAMIAYTCDTGNDTKEAAYLRYSSEILPRAEEQGVRLARLLVASGLTVPGLEVPLQRFRTSIALFREANVPITAELEALGAQYQKVTGGMTAEWDGERKALPQLAPYLESADREIRERAFRRSVEPYVTSRMELAGLFDQMLDRRQRMAANAGYPSFRDYIFPAKYRFDYSAEDCATFHQAVLATVVPAMERTLVERRRRLGLSSLRPWDLAVSPYRPEMPRPFADAGGLAETAARMFVRVDPELGTQFATMLGERLLDLDSRPGKAPGGYCDTLHARGRPFIFMNASGVLQDVTTLLHEAGHAFHSFASHAKPLIWQRHPGSEAAELASMSMEFLAGRWMAQPTGYLPEGDAIVAQLEHFEDVLGSLAHIACVDAFQHWIYTAPEAADATCRDEEWLRIRARFEPGVDWSGLEAERIARWHRQLHIFLYPFYYIEYGIAQLGALQIWRNSTRDRPGAVAAYRRFLSLGATAPLPELYRAAGAELVFDARRMGDLVAGVEAEIEALRSRLPADAEVARG